MKGFVLSILGFICVASTVGCACRQATDSYGDVIDHVSDHAVHFDCLYHPSLDVSRIGKPDWCRCCVNRLLAGGDCQCVGEALDCDCKTAAYSTCCDSDDNGTTCGCDSISTQ